MLRWYILDGTLRKALIFVAFFRVIRYNKLICDVKGVFIYD